MWLFIAFLTVPLIEIGLFIQVGGFIGLWPTLAIVVLTAVLGTFMVRQQGFQALAQVQRSMEHLEDPTEPLAHGAMILVSAVLLLTPGFFTDFIGFALLLPPVRSAAFRAIKSHVTVQRAGHPFEEPRREARDTPIEGEFSEVESSPEDHDGTAPRGSSGWTRH